MGQENFKSADEYASKRIEKVRKYRNFVNLFNINNGHITTEVVKPSGRVDTIHLYPDFMPIGVDEVNLDTENPFKFAPVKYTIRYERHKPDPPHPPPQEKPGLESIVFDYSDEDYFPDYAEQAQNNIQQEPVEEDWRREIILEDLSRKLAGEGMVDVPIESFSLRLVKEKTPIKKCANKAKADAMVPVYRNLEIKRLLTDPTKEGSGYLKTATQRQHVYNQLTDLLRDAGYEPKDIAKYMLEGLFDGSHIAGVPVFGDGKGGRYIVIDYKFSGYDENDPLNTDFSGNFSARSATEIDHIINRAKEMGYETIYNGSHVSGGTHFSWNWHGIKIDDYNPDDMDGNTRRVQKILLDLEIKPKEAVDINTHGDAQDMYMIEH